LFVFFLLSYFYLPTAGVVSEAEGKEKIEGNETPPVALLVLAVVFVNV
jgi:hypothetical protein